MRNGSPRPRAGDFRRATRTFLSVGLLAGLIVLTAACSGKKTGDAADRPVSPEAVAGVYSTTAFVEPGQTDGGVDVHANGGYINLSLSPNHGVEGKIVIPPGVGSNYDGMNQSFLGTWRAEGSNVVIEGTETLVDGHEWTCGDGSLELSVTGRGPMHLKLQKMHDFR